MNRIENVRPCYTQKVIPLAFDESLSYYENVCNLVAKMDEITNFANNELSDKLNAYIDSRFNDIMIDTMYEGETETLIMYINKGGNVNG